MAGLITDLLESERLSGNHTALQREPIDLAALATEVVAEVLARQPERTGMRPEVSLHVDAALPRLALDPTRMRLLLRNLLDNALRHSTDAPQPPELQPAPSRAGPSKSRCATMAPACPKTSCPTWPKPFTDPRAPAPGSTGGVGLGLYLCKLVAQAHGGTFDVRNAQPGSGGHGDTARLTDRLGRWPVCAYHAHVCIGSGAAPCPALPPCANARSISRSTKPWWTRPAPTPATCPPPWKACWPTSWPSSSKPAARASNRPTRVPPTGTPCTTAGLLCRRALHPVNRLPGPVRRSSQPRCVARQHPLRGGRPVLPV